MSSPKFTPVDYVLALFALFIITSLVKRLRDRKRYRYPLPPGPKGYPIIGNLFQVPALTDKAFEIYAKWGTQYGNIISLSVPGLTMIVINDLDVATELLDKKGAIYSERPTTPMLLLAGYDRWTTNLPYDKRLKEQRKLIARSIGTPQYVNKFYSKYEHQACKFIRRVLATPRDLSVVTKKTTGAIQLDLAYGYQINEEEKQDSFVTLLENINLYFRKVAFPGYFWIDYLPFLRHIPRWVPGSGFKTFADEARRLADELVDNPFEVVQQEIASGTNRPSLVSDVLSRAELNQEQLMNLKWAANILYSAGSDTMGVTIRVYFLAMVLYPEVQAKVHAELDRVVGHERLPSFEDRASLPYLQAVVKELFRWYSAVPLGLVHQASEDDIHEGYFIPKGSYISVNIWHLLHDPVRYPDPFTFKPERFLGPEPEFDPYKICFGFGRRICAGLNVADSVVWIIVATSASALHLSKAKTEDGKEIEPSPDQMPGLISRPAPFDCEIKVRHEGVVKLVEEACKEGI